jgi:hypothetical protein
VPIIGATLSFAGGAERLAGTTACPNRSVVWPSGEAERNRPSADAGEEVALAVSAQIVGPHVGDAALVDIAGRDVSGGDEVAQPLGGIGIDLIVVRRPHHLSVYRSGKELVITGRP